ncbi:hypothetical protein [Streptomyces sp. NPDC052042]
MPTARVNGITLSYEVTGHGEPVMLVMGSGAGGPMSFVKLLSGGDE